MTNTAATIEFFIQRWKKSGAAERANYQLFLSELCVLLETPQPDPTQSEDTENAYVFERNVHFQEDDGHSSIGRIDLYKRGAFILEAKQGSDAKTAAEQEAEALQLASAKKTKRRGTAVRGTKGWDDAMVRARGQADRYARALPVSEGWPPFLIVVDVGHVIELYSEFSRSGKTYVPFPDPLAFRIALDDLRKPEIRERLRQVWLDPLSLDPSRRAAKVTRELAQRLAELAKLLEKAQHNPEAVARFLMRALFTMFAEDVELIPRDSFKGLLASLRDEPENFKPAAEDLWRTMNTGGFSPILRKQLLRFNGGLFAEFEALPLTRPMLDLLHDAASADWTDVEPAIFGTLLERALDPVERHKLGAHYTPRAYVERLVLPTVIEPLREDWQAAYAVAVTAAKQGELESAQKTVRDFHEQLCKTRVLDPACGSGNFLYVTLEQMKRLEGEVLNALREFGDKQSILFEVDPHQFLGIEVNPRAAAIADLVLWIGYLQWHFRTRGHSAPAEPIIKNYHNIECRDAVLAWDSREPLLDEAGKPVTRWDGRTMKRHPVTGEDVPDETARTVVERYINPRKAEWPTAEYVVGNPPFIGTARMRDALGDGYTESIRETYKELPESCDFVMYWWHNAGQLVRNNKVRRFGFIATNSLRQTFNRKVLSLHMTAENPLCLDYAIPDHPWIDSADGAAVRISMTVAYAGIRTGKLDRVVSETPADFETTVSFERQLGVIHPDLTIGANINDTKELLANLDISNRGFCLFGSGFVVTKEEAKTLGLGRVKGTDQVVKDYRNGRDITSRSRDVMVIDLYGLNRDDISSRYPAIYQWVLERVKPERDVNPRKSRRDNWWIFGEPNPKLRRMMDGLARYIATVETSKHRFFVLLDSDIVPDNKLVVIASDDEYLVGILSSRIHVCYALAAGSNLGVGNDPVYVKSACFEKFPFVDCAEPLKNRIRTLATQLDAHRKRQQAMHPKLTLTDMYNVLEKLRSGEELSAKDKVVHEQGLVSVLKQIHDDLDAAVFEAYGWPATLTDEQILEKLVALNAERAAEEAGGLIRWLRPEFQNPGGAGQQQTALTLEDDEEAPPAKPGKKKGAAQASPAGKTAKRDWPKSREAQVKAVLSALRDAGKALTPDQLAAQFTRAPQETIEELLSALATLGQARKSRGGKFAV